MNQYPTAYMPAPSLVFEGEGQVSSADFGDVYFSRASGVAETQHVFLKGNGLPERFAGRPQFTIGELGFGTGLNFLVAWRAFLETTGPKQHLHYISVEKFPLTREQLAQLHPESPLLAYYPLRLPGWHRIHFERCTLTLGFGEAEALFGGIDASVDAWFLDGFAPAKNPDMWSDGLFASLARLSAPDATVATFTAAGFVKRGLAAQGFAMEKVRGFAHKRDMLVGRRAGVLPQKPETVTSVLVVGAGIAGCTLAHALAERGVQVTLADKGMVAGGASGNPAAVLYPQLTKFFTPATAWHLTGYGFMLRQLARWRAQGLDFRWEQPGMLRLPREGEATLASLQLDPIIAHDISKAEAGEIAGTAVARDGAFLPQGSWIDPGALCRALAQHANITLREQWNIAAITRQGAPWQAAAALLPEIPMPIGRSAGQVSLLPMGAPVKCIVNHRGYVIPADGQCIVGATYDRSDFSCAVTEANHAENLQHAREALPDWQGDTALDGRVSIRATTPDKLPYVGRVHDGLYVSVGHGSRGMISAPLAAEVLAAQLVGEMVPLTPVLRAAINPLRRAPALP